MRVASSRHPFLEFSWMLKEIFASRFRDFKFNPIGWVSCASHNFGFDNLISQIFSGNLCFFRDFKFNRIGCFHALDTILVMIILYFRLSLSFFYGVLWGFNVFPTFCNFVWLPGKLREMYIFSFYFFWVLVISWIVFRHDMKLIDSGYSPC